MLLKHDSVLLVPALDGAERGGHQVANKWHHLSHPITPQVPRRFKERSTVPVEHVKPKRTPARGAELRAPALTESAKRERER